MISFSNEELEKCEIIPESTTHVKYKDGSVCELSRTGPLILTKRPDGKLYLVGVNDRLVYPDYSLIKD